MDSDEGMSNVIVLLGIQFNKVLKRMDKKSRQNVNNNSSDINKNNDFQRRTRTKEKYNQVKGIQCHGCEGFGHITSYISRNKKKGCMSLGLMMITPKVNLGMNLLNM